MAKKNNLKFLFSGKLRFVLIAVLLIALGFILFRLSRVLYEGNTPNTKKPKQSKPPKQPNTNQKPPNTNQQQQPNTNQKPPNTNQQQPPNTNQQQQPNTNQQHPPNTNQQQQPNTNQQHPPNTNQQQQPNTNQQQQKQPTIAEKIQKAILDISTSIQCYFVNPLADNCKNPDLISPDVAVDNYIKTMTN